MTRTSPARAIKLLLPCFLAMATLVTHAQTVMAPVVSIQVSTGYVAVTITGVSGAISELQYSDSLSCTSDWRFLTDLETPNGHATYVDTQPPAGSARFYRALAIPEPTNMVFIPSGTFTMGSPSTEVDRGADEGPQTVVTISRGFLFCKYPVTQGDYLALVGVNPSDFPGDLSRPVENVSWFDASNYCIILTQNERQVGRLAADWVYRLPTEAEWEYACRAGTTTRFYYGDDPGYTNLVNYAWYGDINGTTHPVGQKLPNPWGLYDMSGNVWEWCLDWYGTYPGGTATDPVGPSTGAVRVLRAGSWKHAASDCRSAARNKWDPDDGTSWSGFRVVLAPTRP